MLNIDIQFDENNIEGLLNNVVNNICERLSYIFLDICIEYFTEIENKFSRYNLRVYLQDDYKKLFLNKIIQLENLGYKGIIKNTSDLSGFVLRDVINNINYKINLKDIFHNLILEKREDNFYIIKLTNKAEIDKILTDIFVLFFDSIGGVQMLESYLSQRANNLQEISDFDSFLEQYINANVNKI